VEPTKYPFYLATFDILFKSYFSKNKENQKLGFFLCFSKKKENNMKYVGNMSTASMIRAIFLLPILLANNYLSISLIGLILVTIF